MQFLCRAERAPFVSPSWRFVVVNGLAAAALLWCIWQCLTMSENRFLELTGALHGAGVAIAFFDGAGMATVFMLLLRDLWKRHTRLAIVGGLIFFVPALAANMLDYFTTIAQTPDLTLETNAVWLSLRDAYGLQVALQFGFWGKIYLSAFAATCFAFYLSNVHLLFPEHYSGPLSFALKMGNRCRGWAQRTRALATLFAFYFAAINLFCFYIAYTNSLVTDLPTLSKLPALPTAIAIAIGVITVAFFTANYAAARPTTYIRIGTVKIAKL